jgi:hypothetical protein
MAQRRARNLSRRLGRGGSRQEVARPRGGCCGGASPTRSRSSAARRCAACASSCSSKGTCCPLRVCNTFRASEGACCHASACACVRTVVSSKFDICAARSCTDAICSNRCVRCACLDFRPEINSDPRAGPDLVPVSRPQRSDRARCDACRFAVTACCVAAGGQGGAWRQDSAGNIHRGPACGRRQSSQVCVTQFSGEKRSSGGHQRPSAGRGRPCASFGTASITSQRNRSSAGTSVVQSASRQAGVEGRVC